MFKRESTAGRIEMVFRIAKEGMHRLVFIRFEIWYRVLKDLE